MSTSIVQGFLASQAPAEEHGHYTEVQVLSCGAGWYLGTELVHTGGELEGLIEPGSRESEYFKTYEEAEEALRRLNWTQRVEP